MELFIQENEVCIVEMYLISCEFGDQYFVKVLNVFGG